VSDRLWKKIDAVEDPPFYLESDDTCYYARERLSHGAYTASEANNLISNLKKHPNTRGTNQWKYKIRAARQFAQEISQVLPQGIAIAFLPTSKTKDDPEYDPRFDMTIAELRALRPDLLILEPIRKAQSTEPAHHGQKKRKVEEIYQSLEWVGFDDVPDNLVLIDDVITCGTNFKAYQRLVLEHHSSVRTIGLFWARTVWLEEDEGG